MQSGRWASITRFAQCGESGGLAEGVRGNSMSWGGGVGLRSKKNTDVPGERKGDSAKNLLT